MKNLYYFGVVLSFFALGANAQQLQQDDNTPNDCFKENESIEDIIECLQEKNPPVNPGDPSSPLLEPPSPQVFDLGDPDNPRPNPSAPISPTGPTIS